MPHKVSMKIWMSREDRVLIDRAAAALGVASSTFVREASVREAQNVILRQTHINIDEKSFGTFVAELDRPPCETRVCKRCSSAERPALGVMTLASPSVASPEHAGSTA